MGLSQKNIESQEDENLEMRVYEDTTSDILVDEYKDLELELMTSSHAKTLWWMKDYD